MRNPISCILASTVTVLLTGGAVSAQTIAVLNDWKESIPDSVVSSGSNTNLIYINGHGFASGQAPKFEIYGGAGTWGPINTHAWAVLTLGLTATDNSIDLDRAYMCGNSGTLQFYSGNEQATYSSATNNILAVSGRGANGTTAMTHVPGEQVFCNAQNPNEYWTATVIDANTLQIPLNSSAFGSFSGTIHLMRWTGDDRYAKTNGAEVGSLWDGQTNSSYQQFMNSCTTGASDIHQCLRAFWTQQTFSGKYGPTGGYSSATCPVTGFTVNSNQTATVNLGTGSLGCSSGYTLGTGWIAYASGMTNNLLNIRPYYVTAASATHVTIAGIDPGVAPGTYTGSGPILQFPSNEPAPYMFNYSATSGGMYGRGSGYMQNYIKSGTFDPASNRLEFTISYTNSGSYNTTNTQGAFYVGTYVKGGGNVPDVHHPGQHFYHYGPPFTMYPGRVMKVDVNAAPDHEVGAAGGAVWPNDPYYSGVWQYPGWAGYDATTHFHYFDGLTSWYINGNYGQSGTPNTMTVGQTSLYTASGEPEELIRTRTIVWTPKRVSDGQAGYEVAWTTPKNSNIQYQVNYSSSGSLKTSGFSTGTNGGTVLSQGSAYTGALWVSPTMSEQGNIWVGIRPTDSISGMTRSGQSPIWVVTQDDLGMQVGDHVTVSSVSGNTNANQTNVALTAVQPRQIWSVWNPMYYTILSAAVSGGTTTITTDHANPYTTGTQVLISQVTSAPSLNGTWTVTVTSPTTFTIPGAISGYSSGDQATVQQQGSLTSIVASSSTCTATTTVPHNLLPGWLIYVSGATDQTLGPNGIAATWTVSAVPSSTTLTFSCPGVANGTYNTSQGASYPLLMASFPGVALANGTAGNGTYNNTCTSIVTCGQIVSTENNKNFAEVTISAQGSVALPSSLTAPLPCDLNNDGVVNSLDVTISTNIALGTQTCTAAADINQDGVCNVIDIQRVSNTAVGGACVTGP